MAQDKKPRVAGQGGAKTNPAKPPLTGKANGSRPPAPSKLMPPMPGKSTRGTGTTSNRVPKGG